MRDNTKPNHTKSDKSEHMGLQEDQQIKKNIQEERASISDLYKFAGKKYLVILLVGM